MIKSMEMRWVGGCKNHGRDGKVHNLIQETVLKVLACIEEMGCNGFQGNSIGVSGLD
jgi:hypothetical protein